MIHKHLIGAAGEVYANQAQREGVIVIAGNYGGKSWALFEYVMPAGRTFLRLLPIDQYGEIDWDGGRSVSYNAIPKALLEGMRQHAAEVKKVFLGGFDSFSAPVGKHWQRHQNERQQQRAAAVIANVFAGM